MKHMETVRLTASQALVRFLENQYISYIDMDGNEVEHKFVKGIFMSRVMVMWLVLPTALSRN